MYPTEKWQGKENGEWERGLRKTAVLIHFGTYIGMQEEHGEKACVGPPGALILFLVPICPPFTHDHVFSASVPGKQVSFVIMDIPVSQSFLVVFHAFSHLWREVEKIVMN
jgi:hypothetical protein